MQIVEPREELIKKAYLNKTEISRLFDIPYNQARKAFKYGIALDKQKLKYMIFENRIRLTTACEVLGVNLKTLANQISQQSSFKKEQLK